MAKFIDLLSAVENGDCGRIQDLVSRGLDIDCRDSYKMTVLHYAAMIQDHTSAVIWKLVELGASVNARDLWGRTPLNCGMDGQKVELRFLQNATIKLLIKLGADINAKFDRNTTSLHRAIRLKNIRAVNILTELGVDLSQEEFINVTALNVAIAQVDTDLVKLLVKLGADVKSSYRIDLPIHEAVESGQLDIVRVLVEGGANMHSYRIDNCTPVYQAFRLRNKDMIQCLATCKPRADLNAKVLFETVIHETVKVGRTDILEYLVSKDADPSEEGGLYTVLALSVVEKDYEMVEALGMAGADVNVRLDTHATPLPSAMRRGDTDMVKALSVYIIRPHRVQGGTALTCAIDDGDPNIFKLLLKYHGDINLRYDILVSPIHDAVARGDKRMVSFLVKELGAALNDGSKWEGTSLLGYHLVCKEHNRIMGENDPILNVLVEAGADLNTPIYTTTASPLYIAVKLGDIGMVECLADLRANMNYDRLEGFKPLDHARHEDRTDLLKYLVEKGADVNSTSFASGSTPLHDAVRLKNCDMARCLIIAGASRKETRMDRITSLHAACSGPIDDGVMEYLIECGANINAKLCKNIRPFNDAVESANQNMVRVFMEFKNEGPNFKTDNATPLDMSIQHSQYDAAETLLKHGADNTNSHLQSACIYGNMDLVRLLVIVGSDVKEKDLLGRVAFDRLPLVNIVDYHVIKEAMELGNIVDDMELQSVSVAGCQTMEALLHTPGIGDVRHIHTPSPPEISESVKKQIQSSLDQTETFPGKMLGAIGSAAEGTKVGLPDEMDFMVKIPIDKGAKLVFKGGYVEYDFIPQTLEEGMNHPVRFRGSAGFYTQFTDSITSAILLNSHQIDSDEKVRITNKDPNIFRYTNRKACSVITFEFVNDGIKEFMISVDIVPSVHVNDWPEGATTKTWLMEEEELRSRGFFLVPKPPHVKSELAKKYTEDEVQTLWIISFSHLETEHMQRLEQRVKDVYITAKCLRNPDACRIMIIDGSFPRNVDKYITSYMLKMIFFKNVDYFLRVYLSLGEMVCKVYHDLECSLTDGFIPLFFLPDVSALSGIKVDIPKSAKVAGIMLRFVKALYLRDCEGRNQDDECGSQVKPSSVYKAYRI